MSDRTLSDPDPAPELGSSRRRVLDLVRTADDPVGVREVADRTGMHRNTARFHLEGLVAAGLARRTMEERKEPGRPRAVYHATAGGGAPGQSSFRLLTQMLTTLVVDALPEPQRAAIGAGAAWGRYLAERPAPFERIDAEEGVRRLSAVLADAGFAPDAAPAAVSETDSPVIGLHHCPFGEIARQHRDVVCSLHLGLMRGVLEEVRAPFVARRLEPYVEPSLCLAYLEPARRRPRGRAAARRKA